MTKESPVSFIPVALARLGLPQRPNLLPESHAEFELHGVDALRGLLIGSTDGTGGTARNTMIKFGSVVAQRGEIQDWLKWKAAIDAAWIKLGVVAAIVAAVFSIIAAFRG